MLENDIKCDNSLYRGRSVLKTPLFSIFSIKRKEKDTAMFSITSPVDYSK